MSYSRLGRFRAAALLIAVLALLCCAFSAFAEGDVSLFTWRLLENGTVCVTGWNSDGDTAEIPETIDGHTVTEIGDGAFRNHTALEHVTMPSTLLRIGAEAFEGCSSYRWVEIPIGVREIGARAFKGCAVRVFSPPRSVTYIGEDVVADSNIAYINVIKFTYTAEWADSLRNIEDITVTALDIARMDFSAMLAAPGEQITCSAIPSSAGIDSFRGRAARLAHGLPGSVPARRKAACPDVPGPVGLSPVPPARCSSRTYAHSSAGPGTEDRRRIAPGAVGTVRPGRNLPAGRAVPEKLAEKIAELSGPAAGPACGNISGRRSHEETV